MPIPQQQLDTWTNKGADKSSALAYASLQHSLLKDGSPVRDLGVEIFLQGSYANFTNIYGDSDVDVVVLYPKTFYKDVSRLSAVELARHEAAFGPATYRWSDLRRDVLTALTAHYGAQAVSAGPKSIKVQTAHGSKPSDVVPAVQFRRYETFPDANSCTAHWGIQFFDSSNNPIVNYPKYHIERGESKNNGTRTGGRYKPTIRVFKNLRNHLIDRRLLPDKSAPSYLLECALHNVPDALFVGDLVDTVPRILTHLAGAPVAGLLSQNGVTPLIGNHATQWTEDSFKAFLLAALKRWNQ